jgi:putative spermidine/putrescine transport system permease protein
MSEPKLGAGVPAEAQQVQIDERSRASLRMPRPSLTWAFIPALLFFFVFLIAPMVVVFYYSLLPNPLVGSGDETVSAANYLYLLSRPYYVDVILRTLRFSAITTVISVAVGYGAVLVLRRISERIGSTAVLVLAFPILSGPIVTVMGWMLMFTSTGAVGRAIAISRGILGLPEASTRLLGTDTAVIIGMVHFNLAFVILNLLSVMLEIDPVLEEAAMNLGARRWQTFRHIIWPLSLPGVFTASLISFALAMNAFINPIYLGNASRLVLTTLISQFMLTSYNWQMASAASVILLWLSLVVILIYNRLYGYSIRT